MYQFHWRLNGILLIVVMLLALNMRDALGKSSSSSRSSSNSRSSFGSSSRSSSSSSGWFSSRSSSNSRPSYNIPSYTPPKKPRYRPWPSSSYGSSYARSSYSSDESTEKFICGTDIKYLCNGATHFHTLLHGSIFLVPAVLYLYSHLF
ncbi:vitellogenin-like [Drosophila eugracilis]|uniref:vitellogenin-like n=1 Tax=Drosophila eugracilis TaxID=29029 RepID=UPI001BDB580E|nr:vitellogenin-like [Drosophila eugracilis]